jgi:hypothetical protein
MKIIFCLHLIIAVLCPGGVAEAQQPTKIPRIGYLNATSPSAIAARTEVFRQDFHFTGTDMFIVA